MLYPMETIETDENELDDKRRGHPFSPRVFHVYQNMGTPLQFDRDPVHHPRIKATPIARELRTGLNVA